MGRGVTENSLPEKEGRDLELRNVHSLLYIHLAKAHLSFFEKKKKKKKTEKKNKRKS